MCKEEKHAFMNRYFNFDGQVSFFSLMMNCRITCFGVLRNDSVWIRETMNDAIPVSNVMMY